MDVIERTDGVLLAVDGGNSKTDVVVYSSDGRVRAARRGPGVSQHVHGTRHAIDLLEQQMTSTLADAGLSLGRRHVRHTAAYLAGVDLPREHAEISRVAAERDWSETVVLDNDTFALFRVGAGAGSSGVAVVCGAGINCVGFGSHGATVRFPSLGFVSGDWGGGLRLAQEVMYVAARAEDGRGPATALQRVVAEHFAVESVLDVIEALHFEDIPAHRLHELNPLLFEAASRGDLIALGLLGHLATEIAIYAVTALTRLNLLDVAVPVVLGGSVLAARHTALNGEVERRILAAAPKADLVVVDAPPILGAALLGLDAVSGGASPAAEERLRAHWKRS